jgi:hypothetical protein
MKSSVSLLVLAAAPVALALLAAAPASAGCETQAFAQYCDGPVKQDGTWDRCMVAFGTVNAFGQTVVPSTSRCFPIDPNAFPTFPLGQPLSHIYP